MQSVISHYPCAFACTFQPILIAQCNQINKVDSRPSLSLARTGVFHLLNFIQNCTFEMHTKANLSSNRPEMLLKLQSIPFCHSADSMRAKLIMAGRWWNIVSSYVLVMSWDRNFLQLNHTLKYYRLSRICVMKGLLAFFFFCCCC